MWNGGNNFVCYVHNMMAVFFSQKISFSKHVMILILGPFHNKTFQLVHIWARVVWVKVSFCLNVIFHGKIFVRFSKSLINTKISQRERDRWIWNFHGFHFVLSILWFPHLQLFTRKMISHINFKMHSQYVENFSLFFLYIGSFTLEEAEEPNKTMKWVPNCVMYPF